MSYASSDALSSNPRDPEGISGCDPVRKVLSTRRVLFFLTTWGFLLTNWMVAWAGPLSLVLLAIRDSWMLLLVVYLTQRKRAISLLFLLIIGLIGAVSALDSEGGGSSVITYIYGYRDLFLIVLLVELLSEDAAPTVASDEIELFVKTVVWFAMLEVVLQNFLGTSLVNTFFNTGSYYSNKGVDINLSNGILGARIATPLYSPNLLCTLLATYYFFERNSERKGFIRFFAGVASIFTLSKVFLVSLFFYVLNKRWKAALLVALVALIPAYYLLTFYYETIDSPLLKYHLASLIGHFSAFEKSVAGDIMTLYPDVLGSNSIAANWKQTEDVGGIESSILVRLSELKAYYLIVVCYFVYAFRKIRDERKRKLLAFFILVTLVTATSNHPVCYVPLIYALSLRNK